MHELPKVATSAEMAEIMRISAAALEKRRSTDPLNHPPHYYLGRRVFYPLGGPNGFEGWMAARLQGGSVA